MVGEGFSGMSTELDTALNERVRRLYERLIADFEGCTMVVHHQLCKTIPLRPSRSYALCTVKGVNDSFSGAIWHRCMKGVSREEMVRLVYVQAVEANVEAARILYTPVPADEVRF